MIAWERKLFAAEKVAQTGPERGSRKVRGFQLTYQQIADSLPMFDPTNTHGMTADTFIAKIEKLNDFYAWEDQLLLYAAQSKLK